MKFKLLVVFVLLLFSVGSANADSWISNSSIVTGLGVGDNRLAPTVYNESGTLKLISGGDDGVFNGWYWNGTSWISDSSIVTGLGDVGIMSTPTVYNESGTLKLISGEYDGVFNGWYWNGTSWISDSSIVDGLGDVGAASTPTVYNDSGTLKLISGEWDGVFNGWYWNGTSWISDSSIVTGLGAVSTRSTPTVYNESGTLKLISGEYDGVFNGWYWNGTSWISDSSIVTGLGDVGDWSAPTVYNESGTLKLISGEWDGVFNGWYWNHAPDVPSVISPSNNSYQKDTPVNISINSIDTDSDTLTYYIYGDTTFGTTLINISSDGSYEWNVEDYDIYWWKARAYDGYEYSANTSLQSFTLIAPPDLQTPTNTSTHTYSFPPLLHDLTFAWQDTDAPAYKCQIAKDSNFNLISKQNTITTNTTTVALTQGDYYWRVYAYETSTATYSDASDVWQFTITETNGGGTTTAIDGVVYEITTAGSVAVDGALVNIWNNTWSDSMLVGQNGYYYFDGAKDGTYSLRSTKTGYTDSSIELVTVSANVTTTRNILLQSTSGSGQQYADHYVKFIVKSVFGTRYAGVTTNVYLNGAVIAQYTGTTGTDGSIAFELDENKEYRITFIDATQGINSEITLYPVDPEYTIYVVKSGIVNDLLNPSDSDQAITAINISVSKTIINANTANITINYNDIMDETTGLTILSQSIAGNITNRTILGTASLGTTNNTAYNFTVSNYNGQSYFIEIDLTHDTHGAISRTYGVEFENTATRFGFSGELVGWLAIIFLTWFALTATQLTVPQTAIGVCALSTVMILIGWGYYISIAGLSLAWIISIAANMAQSKEVGA